MKNKEISKFQKSQIYKAKLSEEKNLNRNEAKQSEKLLFVVMRKKTKKKENDFYFTSCKNERKPIGTTMFMCLA